MGSFHLNYCRQYNPHNHVQQLVSLVVIDYIKAIRNTGPHILELDCEPNVPRLLILKQTFFFKARNWSWCLYYVTFYFNLRKSKIKMR